MGKEKDAGSLSSLQPSPGFRTSPKEMGFVRRSRLTKHGAWGIEHYKELRMKDDGLRMWEGVQALT